MTITAKDMIQALGRTVGYSMNGLNIRVEIMDAKQSYGCLRYQIRPAKCEGSRAIWVESSSLCFE